MAKEKTTRALTYVGPVSALPTIERPAKGSRAKPKETNRPLITGETYDDLPGDHPIVQNLIAHKLLIPASEASPDETVQESDSTEDDDDRSTSDASQKDAGKTKAEGTDQ